MTVEVTKLVTDKEISDKEFEIPKDIEVKPMYICRMAAGLGLDEERRVRNFST